MGRVRDQPVDARARALGVKGRIPFLNGLGAAAARLRVKNANVFAPSASARFAMARYHPPAEEM
ncbi:MAG: hypothetical protein ACLTG4_07080 [Oscillospiraceae bacterium]